MKRKSKASSAFDMSRYDFRLFRFDATSDAGSLLDERAAGELVAILKRTFPSLR